MFKQSWVLTLALFFLSTPIFGVDLSLLGGYRTGGPTNQPTFAFDCLACPQPKADARDGEAFSLIVDIPFRDQLMVEVLLSHQSGEFEGEEFAAIEIYPPVRLNKSFDLTYLHVGFLRQWRTAKVSPFAAVGLGIAQFEANPILSFFEPIDENRLSASLGGGLKIRLNSWLGVRLEGRGYWADMPESAGDDLFQMELSSGLTFKL